MFRLELVFLLVFSPMALAECIAHRDVAVSQKEDIVYYSSDQENEGLASNEFVITIDDGPSSNPDAVLEVLRKYCVKAHFFFIGSKIDARPSVVVKYLSEGHVIGVHGYSHKIFTDLKLDQLSQEVVGAIESVKRSTDGAYSPSFFRFPNFVQDYRAYSLVKKNNLLVIGADISPADWRMDSVDLVVDRFVAQLNKKDRGIIVLHENPNLPGVLMAILSKLYHRGAVVVNLIYPGGG